jgi:thiamine biosynthesis lipoprotein
MILEVNLMVDFFKIYLKSLALAGLFFSLSACNQEGDEDKVFRNTIYGEAQGTTYSITWLGSPDSVEKNEIDSILNRFDLSLSTWLDHSTISALNNTKESSFLIPENDEFFAENFTISQEVFNNTKGYFDPSIKPLVDRWGFWRKKESFPSQNEIDSLKELVGLDRLFSLNQNEIIISDSRAQLDFNAIAQGYSVDVVRNFLLAKDILDFLVEIGGEIYANGSVLGEPWVIGIDKPVFDGSREIQQKIKLGAKGIATSGSYRKYFEKDGKKYSHAIDPFTGYPVEHNLLSVTVVAEHTVLADAYGTAFLVMGTEKTKSFIAENADKKLAVYLIEGSEDGTLKEWFSPSFEELLIR